MTHRQNESMLAAVAAACGLSASPGAAGRAVVNPVPPRGSAGTPAAAEFAQRVILAWKSDPATRHRFGEFGDFLAHCEAHGAPAVDPVANAMSGANLATLEDRILAEWNADAKVRSEFASLETYRSWREREYCQKNGISREDLRNEQPDVAGYIQGLERAGHVLSIAEKQAIAGYADEWLASGDLRSEFGQFSTFAAYRRLKAQGRVRIVGRHRE